MKFPAELTITIGATPYVCTRQPDVIEPEEGPPWHDVRSTMPTNPKPDAATIIAQRGGWWQRKVEDIDGIALHHTLSHNPSQTAAYIVKPRAQGGKGHATTQYHIWITADGEALLCVDLTEGFWHDHCGDRNTHISIGMAGSLHKTKPPIEQIVKAAEVVAYLITEFNIPAKNVAGHNDWAWKCSRVRTVCPGWDSAGWRTLFFQFVDAALDAESAQ